MTDYTQLYGIATILIPLGIGWIAKVAHGNYITKVNAFRNFVDDVDNLAIGKDPVTTTTLKTLVNDVRAIVGKQ
ncbi:MAG: hypothetical protein KGI27_13955 [Thaumarchaeota archaeon]|nr:hypothetical protein [Nitrososphaerota archaeon]